MIDSILELKSRCSFAEEIGKTHNLTARDVSCLSMIAMHGGISLKEIAEEIGLSTSRGSRVVNRLKERGFIVVIPDEVDRRAVKLSLSDSGNECYQDLIKEKLACEQRLSSGLTPEEQKKIQEGLSLLLKVM